MYDYIVDVTDVIYCSSSCRQVKELKIAAVFHIERELFLAHRKKWCFYLQIKWLCRRNGAMNRCFWMESVAICDILLSIFLNFTRIRVQPLLFHVIMFAIDSSHPQVPLWHRYCAAPKSVDQHKIHTDSEPDCFVIMYSGMICIS